MKLYGKIPVLERLKVNPRSIRKIFIVEGHKDSSYIGKKVKKLSIPLIRVPRSKIIKLSRGHNTQGIISDVDDFHYIPYDELIENALKKKNTILFFDDLNDPQNLGGIIRSIACLGGFDVVLPTHKSVKVTEAVLRVSVGGDNYVNVAQVSNLSKAIVQAKRQGFWIAGAVVDEGQDIYSTDFLFPCGIVIGSEHKGIKDIIKKNLDTRITIPMTQQKLSFNVSHATTILCYEIIRQKKNKKRKK